MVFVPTLPAKLKRVRDVLRQSMPSAPSAMWIAAVGLAALAGVGTWFASPRALLIQEVRFEGNQRATVAELRHLAAIPNGTTHLGVSEEAVADSVSRHPWVRDAWLRRTWHGVVVMVEEHRPVALAQLGDGLLYVDSDGSPFLTARSDDLDYPVIAGLDDALVASHPDLPRHVLALAVALLDAADTRALITHDAVSEVVFSPTRGFTVHTRSGARILFGLDGHSQQLDRLSRVIAHGVDLDTPTLVDLAPEQVAIVRSLSPLGEG